MTRKERYEAVIGWFEEHMPVAETELHYTTPFELLVAVILSAQCHGQAGEHDHSTSLPTVSDSRNHGTS